MILSTPWFKRHFAPIEDIGLLPSIIERLGGTAIRIQQKWQQIPEVFLTKPLSKNKWTIQEHVGHLQQIEPLWLGRMQDITNGEKYLREADLTNQSTFDAQFNQQDMTPILQQFSIDRQQLVIFLQNLTEAEAVKSALHPRLLTPMRMIDLAFFVAEHDDHHLVTISTIYNQLQK